MRIYLDVPDEEFDVVREKGGLWCAENHKFYAQIDNLNDFEPWLSDNTVFYPPFEIIRGIMRCHKCGGEFEATGLVTKDVAEITKEELLELPLDGKFLDRLEKFGLAYLMYVQDLPPELLKEIQTINPGYRKDFTYTTQSEYFANHCPHCEALTGDYFLFSEPDAPFGPGNTVSTGKRSVACYDKEMIIQSGFGQRGEI